MENGTMAPESNMIRPRALKAVAACFVVLGSRPVAAQQIVQQPVVQQFSVDTVVGVPDQGRAFLGGVSSAASSQRVYGPIRSGTAVGRSFSSSAVDVGVFIHDFEAMNEALLAAPSRRSGTAGPAHRFRSSRAAAARRSLSAR